MEPDAEWASPVFSNGRMAAFELRWSAIGPARKSTADSRALNEWMEVYADKQPGIRNGS
jgi:hypothetical protein